MTDKHGPNWLYDGDPDNIGLVIPDADPAEGGYILLAEQTNGNVKLFATRFPGRSVAGWKSQITKFGGQKFKRVLVSAAHIRYERIKRLVAENAQEKGLKDLEQFVNKTNELFELRVVERKQIDHNPTGVAL